MRKAVSALFALALLASACGYSFQKPKDYAVREIKIGDLVNLTAEPRLADMLAEELSAEVLRQGIRVNRSSSYVLHGRLDRFELQGVSESNEIFNAYEVVVGGRFFLRTLGGEEIELTAANPFIYTFAANGPLNNVFAARQQATRAALQGLSSEIAARIVYR